jgi:hypothetical protein
LMHERHAMIGLLVFAAVMIVAAFIIGAVL